MCLPLSGSHSRSLGLPSPPASVGGSPTSMPVSMPHPSTTTTRVGALRLEIPGGRVVAESTSSLASSEMGSAGGVSAGDDEADQLMSPGAVDA